MNEAIAKIAEQKILAAIENGELDNLPGQGKPLKVEEFSSIPFELRPGYRVLKNAGILPEEMELKKQIAAMQELLDCCQQESPRENIKKKIAELRLEYSLRMEKRR